MPHQSPEIRSAEWIEYLYREREHLSRTQAHVLNEPDNPSDPRTPRGRIRQAFASASLSPFQPDLLFRAFNFWTEHASSSDEEQRLRYADELLKLIDDAYANRSIQVLPATSCTVAVGRRWWVSVATHQRRSPPIDHKRSVHAPFPFVRVLPPGVQIASVRGTRAAFARLGASEIFRVACCTFSGRFRTSFIGTAPVHGPSVGRFGFRATHIGEPVDGPRPVTVDGGYIDELRACIARARAESAHVLLLPELCVCEIGRAAIKEELERDPGELLLVVPGSFHVDAPIASRAVNSAPLWIIHRGAADGATTVLEPMQVEKSEIFDLAVTQAARVPGLKHAVDGAQAVGCDRLAEDIVVSKLTRLLHTPVGTVLVLVCRDALTPPIGGYIEHAMSAADHVVIVAFNSSPNAWFLDRARQAGRRGTAVYLVNAGQALVGADPAAVELAGVVTPLEIRLEDGAAFGVMGFRTPHPRAATASIRNVSIEDWFMIDLPAPADLRHA